MFASLQIIWPQSGLCRPSEIFLFSTDSGLISRMTELQITALADDSLNDDANASYSIGYNWMSSFQTGFRTQNNTDTLVCFEGRATL